MSQYRRPRIPGAPIFFTVALQARGADTLITRAEALRVAVRHTRAERPFHIDAAVILPDHLHMIWTLPPGDSDYPKGWRVIKTRFTHAVPDVGRPGASRLLRRERRLWQRRYWEHQIRGPVELAEMTRFCGMNPVNHGLVSDPFDWPHSSIHRHTVRGMAVELPGHT